MFFLGIHSLFKNKIPYLVENKISSMSFLELHAVSAVWLTHTNQLKMDYCLLFNESEFWCIFLKWFIVHNFLNISILVIDKICIWWEQGISIKPHTFLLQNLFAVSCPFNVLKYTLDPLYKFIWLFSAVHFICLLISTN